MLLWVQVTFAGFDSLPKEPPKLSGFDALPKEAPKLSSFDALPKEPPKMAGFDALPKEAPKPAAKKVGNDSHLHYFPSWRPFSCFACLCLVPSGLT